MATDLEFREAVATAEKLSSLISDTVIGEFLTDQQHREFERCKRIVEAFTSPPSVQQRVPAFRKALEEGIQVRHIFIPNITGENISISVSKIEKNAGYTFAILVNSDIFETEEECLEAAVTYLKEL
jgi:DNA repair photolyase